MSAQNAQNPGKVLNQCNFMQFENLCVARCRQVDYGLRTSLAKEVE